MDSREIARMLAEEVDLFMAGRRHRSTLAEHLEFGLRELESANLAMFEKAYFAAEEIQICNALRLDKYEGFPVSQYADRLPDIRAGGPDDPAIDVEELAMLVREIAAKWAQDT